VDDVVCFRPSAVGKVIENEIGVLSRTYDILSVDHHVVMPNHVHLLLVIQTDIGRPQAAPTVSRMVNQFKGKVTKRVGAACGRPLSDGDKRKPLWQKGFHDRVIRDQRDYERVWEYIENNLHNWLDDEYYDRR